MAEKQGNIAEVIAFLKATLHPGICIFEAVTQGLLNMNIMTVGERLKSVVCKKLSSRQGLGGE